MCGASPKFLIRQLGYSRLFRRLVAGLSSRSPKYDPRPVDVGFATDRMTLGQTFSRYYRSTNSQYYFNLQSLTLLDFTNRHRINNVSIEERWKSGTNRELEELSKG
jgi:hypothetical protein